MNTTDSYAQRVEEEITAQNLRPIMEALTAERIPFTVEQTGGYFMVGFTELPSGGLVTWNAESVGTFTSMWAYCQDAEPWREVRGLNPAAVAQTVTEWALEDCAEASDDLAHLWRTMDADTYAKDSRIRAEIAHRIGREYSLYESIADNYGSIPDNIPSAQDYADTISTQFAEMFPEATK